MLEALVAIGLAGNVVQFAQVAAGLISQADDIRKNGAPSSLRDIRKLTVYLIDQTKAFHAQLDNRSTQEPPTEEDQASAEISEKA
jgi:hypothetical protein